jgi:hypothetical protein
VNPCGKKFLPNVLRSASDKFRQAWYEIISSARHNVQLVLVVLTIWVSSIRLPAWLSDEFAPEKNVNELVPNLMRYILSVRVVLRWYKDSVMGPSQKWINERSFAEQLFARWAKLTVDSEKEYF